MSHAAAAWLFGLPGGDPAPQVTLPLPARRKLPGVRVHSTTFLPDCDRTLCDRIPITQPARLAVDLAAVMPRRALEVLLDAVLSRPLASEERIASRLTELSTRGRPGVALLDELLQARSKDGGVPASVLESLARLLLAGLPPHRFNRRVVADKERVVDIDFDGVPLTGELDGWANHSGRARYQDDIRRQNALVSHGRTPLRFTYEDVTEDPQRVRAAFIDNGRRLAQERSDLAAQAAWAAIDFSVPDSFFALSEKPGGPDGPDHSAGPKMGPEGRTKSGIYGPRLATPTIERFRCRLPAEP
ncbi:MAG: DUF559 domain-containing protein [Actinomycetota bacterium]